MAGGERPPPPGGVRVSAPATVGNLACGFDVLGLAAEAPRDEVLARPAPGPGVTIAGVKGDGGRLPRDPGGNVAGVAAAAVLRRSGARAGVVLEIRKGIPLAGGLGGSAASAVAGAVAADAALGTGLSREALLACALEGERVAAGAPHPDNVAPALCGGIVLVRSRDPLDLVELPVPEGLAVALAHPHLEVPTEEARRILPGKVPLGDAVAQWGNTAALVAGLFRGDLELVGRALEDRVAEPVRARLVPGFHRVKGAALEAGALGASLSGAGPTVFALCASEEGAREAARAMAEAFRGEAGLEVDVFVSPVSRDGVRVLRGEGSGAGG